VADIKPIFRVLLDTDGNPDTGEQLVYTSSGSNACVNGSTMARANPFNFWVTDADSKCNGQIGGTTKWSGNYHQVCAGGGPAVQYLFANAPCSIDPVWGNRRYYWLTDPTFKNQFDIVGYGGTGACENFWGATSCFQIGNPGANGCGPGSHCPTDEVIVRMNLASIAKIQP
jgi:hypothetical protein